MAKRHKEALEVLDACNPGGVAGLLAREMSAFMRSPEYTGTTSLRNDPALRLIAYKLASLFDVSNMTSKEENSLYDLVHARKNETRPETWAERAKRGGLTLIDHFGQILWINAEDVAKWARIVRVCGDPLVEIPNWVDTREACEACNLELGEVPI